MTGLGAVSNKKSLCPLARLPACKCKAKITETSREIKIFIADILSSADYDSKMDLSRYLKAEQRKVTATVWN